VKARDSDVKPPRIGEIHVGRPPTKAETALRSGLQLFLAVKARARPRREVALSKENGRQNYLAAVNFLVQLRACRTLNRFIYAESGNAGGDTDCYDEEAATASLQRAAMADRTLTSSRAGGALRSFGFRIEQNTE
jgi:hypothetical protein